MPYYVYIVTNRPNGTLYIGMTSNLPGRVAQHRTGRIPGFTQTYGLKQLVYYEFYENVQDAIWHEKRLKTWNRAWKVKLILQTNPAWRDLWDEFGDLAY